MGVQVNGGRFPKAPDKRIKATVAVPLDDRANRGDCLLFFV